MGSVATRKPEHDLLGASSQEPSGSLPRGGQWAISIDSTMDRQRSLVDCRENRVVPTGLSIHQSIQLLAWSK